MIKVGDRVRVIGRTYYGHLYKIGMIVTVGKIRDAKNIVCFLGHRIQVLHPCDLQVINKLNKLIRVI
jgi:hypothetical protein